MKKFETSNSVF